MIGAAAAAVRPRVRPAGSQVWFRVKADSDRVKLQTEWRR